MRPRGCSATPDLDAIRISTGHVGKGGQYLTDEVNLYRYLGTIGSARGNMVGLENCYSLDVTLWPVGDVHARNLRGVTPAPDEESVIAADVQH